MYAEIGSDARVRVHVSKHISLEPGFQVVDRSFSNPSRWVWSLYGKALYWSLDGYYFLLEGFESKIPEQFANAVRLVDIELVFPADSDQTRGIYKSGNTTATLDYYYRKGAVYQLFVRGENLTEVVEMYRAILRGEIDPIGAEKEPFWRRILRAMKLHV
ncbi:MAG: hypothetical protein AAB567_01890 [Patescibacteria group bacterium]